MADVYGTYHTNRYQTVPKSNPPGSLWGNKVRFAYDTYEAAALAADSVIYMGPKLTKGTQILPWTTFMFDDLGTGITVDIGLAYDTDTNDPDALVNDADVASAAVAVALSDVADIGIVPYELTDDGYVIITPTGGASTGTIKMFLVFSNAQ